MQIAGPHAQSFRFPGYMEPANCISNRFPGEADASGPGTTPLDPLGLSISITVK